MSDAPGRNRIGKRAGHMLLGDNLFERLGTVFSCQYKIGHNQDFQPPFSGATAQHQSGRLGRVPLTTT